MSYKNWPDQKLMTLPDEKFGVRFPVSVGRNRGSAGTFYDMAETPFPDKCVIWELNISWYRSAGANARISLRLGDYIPATAAQFNALPNFMDGWGEKIQGGNQVFMCQHEWNYRIRMRKLITPQGMRLIGREELLGTSVGMLVATVIVSSLPTDFE